MSKVFAEYSDTFAKDVNEDLFDRRRGRQIHEFMIDDLKSIEMIPNVYVRNIQFITDPSKIDVRLNRKNIKSKKILKNKIEKLIPINHTVFDALKFDIDIGGEYLVQNTVLVPKYVDRYHFYVNGNKTLVMFQVVDNAIYNQKGDVTLKTRIPARLSRINKAFTLLDVESGKEFKVNSILINLFKKKFNPLYYYAASKGILGTIEYFGYKHFVDVVTEVRNPELFYYFRINSNLLMEVEKTLLNNDSFFGSFVGMLMSLFNTRNKIEDVYDIDFWIKRLGSLFITSSKNQHKKGQDVLRSFKNVLDATTKRTLRVAERDKADIYAVIRWMMRDFSNLRNSDNNDLQNRRIRTNEYIAAYFGRILKEKLTYALNMKPFDTRKLSRAFKLDEYVLFKPLFGGAKACPLFRYNIDINDLQAINGLKYSVTGIQGLPSNLITDEQRDLYPSHLGRFELNSISSSSPGASGMLTPFCDIYGDGYFGKPRTKIKAYRDKIQKRIDEVKKNKSLFERIKEHHKIATEIHSKRIWQFKYSKFRNKNGFIIITKPEHKRNNRGYISVTPKTRYVNYARNDNGFIIIARRNVNRPKIVPRLKPMKIVLREEGK